MRLTNFFNTGILIVLATAAQLSAQVPAIAAGGIVNAGSGDAADGGIAQGSYFLIFGTNLASSTTSLASIPLPTTFGGAQVRIRSLVNSTTYEAPLYFASPGQINAVLPSGVPVGNADVTVTVGSSTSSPRRILVQRNRVGIFTIFNLRNGQALVQNYNSATQVSLNQFLNPARNGQTMILWATGLGPYLAGPDNLPPAAGNIADNVEVMVGDIPIRPFYAGRAPGIPGFDQINFTLPSNVPIPDGCAISLQIRMGTVLSNRVSFAKSASKDFCEHPLGLSRELLARLDQGGTVAAGYIGLTRANVQLAPGFRGFAESAKVIFSQFQANGSPFTVGGVGINVGIAPGNCIVFAAEVRGGSNPEFEVEIVPRGRPTDAGQVRIESKGKSETFETDNNGSYTADLGSGVEITGVPIGGSAFLSEGTVTVRGSGGRVIGPFSADIEVRNLLTLTEQDRVVDVTRNQPLTFRWSGGGNSPEDMVSVGGIALTDPGSAPIRGTVFQCSAPATARTFTVPAEIMRQLPSNAAGGYLMVGSIPTGSVSRFTAPLAAGGNIDSGIALMGVTDLWLYNMR